METNTVTDRLFRAGDKIRIVAWRGRHPFDLDMDEFLAPGLTGSVSTSETPRDCCITILLDRDSGTEDEGGYYTIPTHFLELVQAAEEQPFFIEEDNNGRIAIYKRGPDGIATTVAIFFWHPRSVENSFYYDEAKSQAFHTLHCLNNKNTQD